MKKCKQHSKDMHPSSRSAIRSALRSSEKRGTPLRVYFDHECKSFHLTKQPKREKAAA